MLHLLALMQEEVQVTCSAAPLQLYRGCMRLQLPPQLVSALHSLQPLNSLPRVHHPAHEAMQS